MVGEIDIIEYKDAKCVLKAVLINDIVQASNYDELLAEYADECAIRGLPHPMAKIPMYESLEAAGAIHTIAAYYGQVLVGFVLVLSSVLPHFGSVVSTTESFFVHKSFRKTGAGMMLRRKAEDHAKEIGSPGLLISAPSGGILDKMLSLDKGYVETNRVYFKGFDA